MGASLASWCDERSFKTRRNSTFSSHFRVARRVSRVLSESIDFRSQPPSRRLARWHPRRRPPRHGGVGDWNYGWRRSTVHAKRERERRCTFCFNIRARSSRCVIRLRLYQLARRYRADSRRGCESAPGAAVIKADRISCRWCSSRWEK